MPNLIGTSQPRRPTPVWVVVFGGILFITGLVIALVGIVQPWWASHMAQAWVATPCVIDSGQVIVTSNSSRHRTYTHYALEIDYHYAVDGRNYASNRYDFTHGYSDTDWETTILDQYHPGSSATCYVNPQDLAISRASQWAARRPLM